MTTMYRCDQCGGASYHLSPSEHGWLCPTCAHRQAEHDDAHDRFEHLSASSFGFASEDE